MQSPFALENGGIDLSEQQSSPEKEDGGIREFLGDLLDILETAVGTVFVFLMLFAFTMRPVTVDGGSMNPTLYDGDKLLIATPLHSCNYGDIVVIDDQEGGFFSDPEETDVFRRQGLQIVIVKRVIAHGGQEINIDFESGTVTVDGTVLDEPYIADPTTRNDGAFTYPLTVPEGYIFVMGDNRLGSSDSRNPAVGLVPQEQVLGTAFLRYGRNSDLCSSWRDKFAILIF